MPIRVTLTGRWNTDASAFASPFMTQPTPTEPNPAIASVFREFLYADIDRVRSLFAQLVGGVPEEERATDSTSHKFNVGIRSYLGYAREGKAEDYQQRSLLDALFPELEQILEAEGWLTDISDLVHDSSSTDTAMLRGRATEGSIIRLTADAQLFDAEYVAQVLGGTSIVVDGITHISGPQAVTPPNQPKKGGGNRGGERRGRTPPPSYTESGRLEDLIEDFDPRFLGIPPQFLRDIVRVSRGMFSQGLHMLVSTEGGVGWSATTRLQQGRRYLDAEPDVLFSRYGTKPQAWTIVGTVGHFSSPPDAAAVQNMNFMSDDGSTVSRPKFVKGLNSLLSLVAGQGFADTPPYPGFSIIPMAVYRLIPRVDQVSDST